MYDSLQPHGLQHARLPRPLLSASVCSNSCPLNQWCHPNSSSSIPHFSSCPQSFPASGSFPVSQLFTSGSQNFGASASASVLPMNIQGWFPLGLTGLISLFSKETNLSRVFCSTSIWKHQVYSAQSSLWLNSHIHIWLLEKTIALTTQIFVVKVMSLIFNTLSRFLIAFLPRSKHLLILWLSHCPHWFSRWRIWNWYCFHFSPIYLPWHNRARFRDRSFLNVEFQVSFFTLLFHLCQEVR